MKGSLWQPQTNICIIDIPEGREREKGTENLFEEIAENVPELGKENRFRKHRVLHKMNPKEIHTMTHK